MGVSFDSLERAHSLAAAFNRRDVAAILAHFDAAASWNRGEEFSLKGRDSLARPLMAFLQAFPDALFTGLQFIPLGTDTIVAEWTLAATHLNDWRVPEQAESFAASGRSVRMTGADILRFNTSGLIVSDSARMDLGALFGQLAAAVIPEIPATHVCALAERYTAAWGSQRPESVAAFYSEEGSLRINDGVPAMGRASIAASARSFMNAFPDMKVIMNILRTQGNRALYEWTLIGTNTGSGGTGRTIHLRGFEVWQFGPDGLIAESRGHYDTALYDRQLREGA